MEALFDRLICEIELPDEWENFFEMSDASPGSYGDMRRFARAPLRTAAAMHHERALPGAPRDDRWRQIYIKDISCGGVGFVHGEQLFPCERLKLILPENKLGRTFKGRRAFDVEVARCRYVQEKCWVVGAEFLTDGAT